MPEIPQSPQESKMEEPITDPYLEATSAVKIAGNEDLATEIFIRLPAASLAPCLRVSKLWLSFISNQTFVSRHTLIHPPSLSGLFLIPRPTSLRPGVHYLSLNHRKPDVLPFITFLNSKGFQIIHSCNGLWVCQLGVSHYYVCNPSTRQLRVFPGCSYMDKEFTLNLAFDPLTSPVYKVICVQKLKNQQQFYQIAIYSSVTCAWSLAQEPVFVPNHVDFKNGVFCKGAIHWMTTTSRGVYLDLRTKIVREMPQPSRQEEESQYKFKYFGSDEDMEIVLSVPGEVIFFNLKKKTSTIVRDPVFRPIWEF